MISVNAKSIKYFKDNAKTQSYTTQPIDANVIYEPPTTFEWCLMGFCVLLCIIFAFIIGYYLEKEN